MAIYGGPSYQMGSVDFGASNIGGVRAVGEYAEMGASQISLQGVTPEEAMKAQSEILKMRRALTKWLGYRAKLNLAPNDLLPVEAKLGQRLYVLLSEMFDAQQLPAQTAVVNLAQIAVAGKLPTEVSTPSAQGFVFLWPLVAVVGLVMLTIVTKIKSDADDAADARHNECVMKGQCVDSGMWMKWGGIALVAWIAWDKFGLKKAFGKGS